MVTIDDNTVILMNKIISIYYEPRDNAILLKKYNFTIQSLDRMIKDDNPISDEIRNNLKEALEYAYSNKRIMKNIKTRADRATLLLKHILAQDGYDLESVAFELNFYESFLVKIINQEFPVAPPLLQIFEYYNATLDNPAK